MMPLCVNVAVHAQTNSESEAVAAKGRVTADLDTKVQMKPPINCGKAVTHASQATGCSSKADPASDLCSATRCDRRIVVVSTHVMSPMSIEMAPVE